MGGVGLEVVLLQSGFALIGVVAWKRWADILGKTFSGSCLVVVIFRYVSVCPGEKFYAPLPFPAFLAIRAYVYFEFLCGRNFIRPPLLYAPCHPLKGIFRAGGWGCIRSGPGIFSSSGGLRNVVGRGCFRFR